MQGWLPRPLIIAAIVLITITELVFRMPDLLLIKEKYEAQKAEYLAKLYQTDTAKAQLQKAQADADRSVSEAKAAQLQPDTAAAQLAKAGFDATIARYSAAAAPSQPGLVTAQLQKARNDAEASAYQPDLAKASLSKGQSEAATAALQPDFTKLQIAKLGVDTKVALATLPANLQAAGLSNNIMSIFGPLMQSLTGGMPSPSSQEQTTAPPGQGSPTSRQQAFAPPARAPATGPALLATDRFAKLAAAANEAISQRDCARMVQIYKEGMPIVRSALGKATKEEVTSGVREQALAIAGLRTWINDPTDCHGERVD